MASAVLNSVAGNSTHLGPLWHAVQSNLGDSSHLNERAAHQPRYPPVTHGYDLPVIPPGVPTTFIPIAFPLTTEAPDGHISLMQQKLIVLSAILVAGIFWLLPWMCINRKLCCRCFTRWMSRRLRCYFLLGLVVNLIMISLVIDRMPDVTANEIFFSLVHLMEEFSEKLEQVLTQLAIVVAGITALAFRRKLVSLLGFDQQFIRADLRDVLTCFTMNRFVTIEVSMWKMENLPSSFSRRSLFARVILGYNEPQHSRPHEISGNSLILRERVQLNYDPEDVTQKLSIVLKQQEVVGGAISQLAPAAGLLVGAAAGAVTPLGPAGGAGLGVVTGVGAANSLGVEVARVDLSSVMINRLRKTSTVEPQDASRRALETGPSTAWSEDHFKSIDLVPQGKCWIRITDVSEP